MNLVVSHWSANPVPIAAVAAVAVVHLRGSRALRQPPRQAACFQGGLLLVLAAVVSPVGYWAYHHIWVRSLQDLLLAIVIPALVVLGGPWQALALGVRRHPAADAGQRPARAGDATAGAGDAAGGRYDSPAWRSWPVAVTIAFNAAWWAWHLPALYDAALRHPVAYAAEIVIYLGVGIAFWLQLIGSGPVTPRFPPLPRVMLITGTVVSQTVLGMALTFSYSLLYRAYLLLGQRPVSVLWDEQLGGAVLWVLALPPLVITAVALLIRWLNEEESEALAAGVSRLLKPSKSAWPARPGVR